VGARDGSEKRCGRNREKEEEKEEKVARKTE